MEVYNKIELDNGDILLEKYTVDMSKFIIIDCTNGNKLLKKINKICITEIEKLKYYDLKFSTIIMCHINGNICKRLKYKAILNTIYILINDGAHIIKNSLLNIKTTTKNTEGYYYLHNLGISIQGVDSNKSLLEIITQCNINKIKFDIEIKLLNDSLISIDIN